MATATYVSLVRFNLYVFGATDPGAIIRQFVQENESAKDALTVSGGPNGLSKWHRHEEELRTFSKKYPELIFDLSGEGEHSSDIWDKYFLNGLMQVSKAVIVKPPFNPAELR